MQKIDDAPWIKETERNGIDNTLNVCSKCGAAAAVYSDWTGYLCTECAKDVVWNFTDGEWTEILEHCGFDLVEEV